MTALDIAVNLIAKWEGLSLAAYLCPAGVWTIGYGQTKGVKSGDVWTKEQAEADLRKTAQQFLEGALKAAPRLASFTSNQQAACTSLAYNIGLSTFASSTVAKRIAQGDRSGAADAFLLWNKARVNGALVPVQGLTNRRQDERRVFLSAETI